MRKKSETCFMLMAAVSMIGLFSCSKAIACAASEARQAELQEALKKLPVGTVLPGGPPGGKMVVGPNGTVTIFLRPSISPVRFFKAPKRIKISKRASVVKKEVLPVPLYVQAANLRNTFENIPISNNEEVDNALDKSFDAQLAKIVHEYCQERKKDISKMVVEELPKDKVVASVQIIATDEFKKAALEFLKSCNPRVKIELSKLQKLSNPIDANSPIGFDPLEWQSKRHPINPSYAGYIFDKFSADPNNLAKREAVRIFSLLEAEVLYSATTANLSVTEDANTITKSEQPESTKPNTSVLPVSTITKAD